MIDEPKEVAPPESADGSQVAPPAALPSRASRLARRIRRPRVKITRGRLLAFFLIFAFGSLFTAGATIAVVWTDTPEFCGRCHTMAAEIKGHAASPHRALTCGECHVEPGIEGWVKAKLNGTRQLLQLLTGTYATPIPEPDHSDLPPTSMTCARCHDSQQLQTEGGPLKLILETRYLADEYNTRQPVAFVLRPAGFGGSTATRGVHWHVGADVEFTSSDPRLQTIDLVRVTAADGTTTDYLALGQVGTAADAQPDIDRILAKEQLRRMDCIDCHNRVGHNLPTADQAVDQALSEGRLDTGLPFLKQQAVERLGRQYPSAAVADDAMGGLRSYYRTRYPLIADTSAASINSAVDELRVLYRLVASPEVGVIGTTYPDNMGHSQFPGCFRCHDGGHYKVVNGALSGETITSACATCHTFPQIGPNNSAILIGQRPDTHDDRFWVFSHKTAVAGLEPAGTTCGACHTRSYCENCHSTAAVQVPHDQMVYNHADVVRNVGAGACSLCHQATYCAQCHVGDILGSTTTNGIDLDLPPPTLAAPTPELILP